MISRKVLVIALGIVVHPSTAIAEDGCPAGLYPSNVWTVYDLEPDSGLTEKPWLCSVGSTHQSPQEALDACMDKADSAGWGIGGGYYNKYVYKHDVEWSRWYTGHPQDKVRSEMQRHWDIMRCGPNYQNTCTDNGDSFHRLMVEAECVEVVDECPAGEKVVLDQGSSTLGDADIDNFTYCSPNIGTHPDGCEVVLRSIDEFRDFRACSGGGACAVPKSVMQTFESNGEDCGSPEPPPTAPSSDLPIVELPGEGGAQENATCFNGDQYVCISREKTNCGWINGHYSCLGTATDQLNGANPCRQLADGSVHCLGSASTPPAPDTGDPGVPADPDATLNRKNPSNANAANAGGDTTINNYGAGTVQGSTTGGNPDGNDGEASGNCDPATESCNEGGGGEAKSECTGPPPSCTDVDSIQCAILRQQWETQCALIAEPDTSELNQLAGRLGADGLLSSDGNSLIEGTGITGTEDLSETFSVIPDGWLARECPADLDFPVPQFMGGGTVAFPLSNLCPFFEWMGLLLVLLATMRAAIIVGS